MSLVEKALDKMMRAKPREQTPHGAAPDAGRNEHGPKREAIARPTLADLPFRERISLPMDELRAQGMLPQPDRERAQTDQYRRIKRPLIAAVLRTEGEPLPMGRSLVVTSAISGEGKSYTSLNLAISFSMEKDFNVLLVDGDVPKRGLSEAFRIGGSPGLMDLITQPDRDIQSCILATNFPGLYFLPAGERLGSAPEALGSARMHDVFSEFLDRYPSCFILFDSPPILMAAESRSLLPIGGQIVFVVKAGETPRQKVLDAITAVGASRPTSLLLNQLDSDNDTSYGYDYPPESQRASHNQKS